MEILRPTNESKLILNYEHESLNDLGWSESFTDYENDLLDIVINDLENYETVRYIHKEYSGITTNTSDKINDIWIYFYFISGSTYVQNYEAIGLSKTENSKLTKQLTSSFFRLEFFKTPNDESPNRTNRKLVFAKNIVIPSGEKYFLTSNNFNDYIYVPVFIGSNYKNKENMYFFWFQDDTPYNETQLTGNTFYMTAKFFNGDDGSVIDFVNNCFSTSHQIVESDDMYYKVIVDMNEYSYIVYEFDGTIGDRCGVRNNPIKFYEKGGGNC
jgi:hypothetical protein